jgi:magnesium transporter
MAYATIFRDEDGTMQRGLDEAAMAALVERPRGLLWMHVTETTEDDVALLGRVFSFHPLALQECLSDRYQRPKAEHYADHLFVMLHGIDHDASGELVVTTELDLFIGPGYVVTASLSRLEGIEQLLASAGDDERTLARGSAMLGYDAINALIGGIFPTIDLMTEFTDGVEETALTHPHRELLPDILRLKRSSLRVHRVLVPQRDVLNLLGRGDSELIGREALPYYRYLYDQVVRIEDLTQSIRERADATLTTYLSAVGIRQNETMRVLSIVASVFLPLTLLTGVYGMNFAYMPGLAWRGGFFAVVGVMLGVSGAVVWFFWARDLIGAGRRRAARVLTFRVDPSRIRDAVAEANRLREAVLDPRRFARR